MVEYENPANLHDAQATANYIPESSTIYDGALAIDWTCFGLYSI